MKYIILGAIFILGCYLTSLSNKKVRHCGTIIEIQNQPYKVKYEIYYDQYFLVNLDSVGMKAIKVDMTTFMSHKKGDKICFTLTELSDALLLLGLTLVVISGFLIIAFIFNIP
jgi:hypothetical protein